MSYHFRKPRRAIDRVFVHCSASDHTHHDNVETMRAWHLQRGWSDVGYHYFIRKNGLLELGRPLERTPAAQGGHNRATIAICLHGLDEGRFTKEQFETLRLLCMQIDEAYDGRVTFHGHNEVAAKACPVFDRRAVLKLSPSGALGIKGAAGLIATPSRRALEKLELPEAADTKRPTLRQGARGRDVRLLQQELTDLGYHVGRIDGHFGRRTRAAVLAFQEDNHLIADGIVGPATYEALADAQPRLIGAERASATVFSLAGGGSRIASASITQGATGALVAGGGALGLLEQASGTVSRITEAVGPFGDTLRLLGPWIGAAVLVAGTIVVWQSIKAGRARVEDHRTGKTS